MTATHEIRVNGECLVLLSEGALLVPKRGLLAVADMHLEKGADFARRGSLLPPYDTRATLARLESLVAGYRPETVLALGDTFHRADSERFMDEDDALRLEALTRAVPFVWVLGNHDPAPPKRFTGEVALAKRVGRLVFRHEPSASVVAAGEVAGHLHPCARVRTDIGGQRRRCFAADPSRLVLPAFGAFAGGLNVLDGAIRPLFGSMTVHVLGRRGVYSFGEEALAPDMAGAQRLRA